MSSCSGRLREVLPVAPGRCLVVEGACLEASVQDADEPVGQPPQGVVVLDPAGAELVVVGACAGRGVQGRRLIGPARGPTRRPAQATATVTVRLPGGRGYPGRESAATLAARWDGSGSWRR